MSECGYIDGCRILESFRTDAVRQYWMQARCAGGEGIVACRRLYESGCWQAVRNLARDDHGLPVEPAQPIVASAAPAPGAPCNQ